MSDILTFPHNEEAERTVLSCLILDNGLIPEAIEKLTAEHFNNEKNKIIFKAIHGLFKEKKSVDLVILSDALKDKAEPFYLAQIAGAACTSANFPHYADILNKHYLLRSIIAAASNLIEQATKCDDPSKLLNDTTEGLSKLAQWNILTVSTITLDLPAMSLTEFAQRDIPPINYIVEGLLQENGKTMISGVANVAKSIFLQNLALCMTSGKESLLDKFKVQKTRVLYCDLEMGNSALSQRFKIMCKDLKADDLYIKYYPSIDLMNEECRKDIEKLIVENDIKVLILDPLSNAWAGNENEKQEVVKLTTYLNTVIARYGVSILIAHHWRKGTQHFKSGGEMASGSHQWTAWLDNHITLSGTPESISVECQKARNCQKFPPFRAKLNRETLWLEYAGDYEIKYTESTLEDLYTRASEQQGTKTISIKSMVDLAKKDKVCSRGTIQNLILQDQASAAPKYTVNKSGKVHTITEIDKGYIEDPDELF
jgi:replicative DNA helicase